MSKLSTATPLTAPAVDDEFFILDQTAPGNLKSIRQDELCVTGSWTPILSDGTNNATAGTGNEATYSRIGNVVFVRGRCITNGLGSVSGSLRITGLPFVVVTGGSMACGAANGMTITAGDVISGYFGSGTSYITLTTWDSTGGATDMQSTEWGASGTLWISGFYFA